ncbi:MAG: hypothetical protein VW907_03495, partial [Opitutae bacterium]
MLKLFISIKKLCALGRNYYPNQGRWFILLFAFFTAQLNGQNWPSSPASPIPSNTESTALETEIEIGSPISSYNDAVLISVLDPWTKPLPNEPSWLKSWTVVKFGPNKGTVYHEYKNNRNYFYYRPYP